MSRVEFFYGSLNLSECGGIAYINNIYPAVSGVYRKLAAVSFCEFKAVFGSALVPLYGRAGAVYAIVAVAALKQNLTVVVILIITDGGEKNEDILHIHRFTCEIILTQGVTVVSCVFALCLIIFEDRSVTGGRRYVYCFRRAFKRYGCVFQSFSP